jgi:hypothetical protein
VLDSYEQRTQLLLADTKDDRFNTFDLRTYINLGRAQTAADGECIRQPATISTVAGQRAYRWSTATFSSAPAAPAGLLGILSVRGISRQILDGPGQVGLRHRSWESFNSFNVQHPAPVAGIPVWWTTLQPGDEGTFWVDPIPDDAYLLILDPVCVPAPLLTDDDPEALPYPWTDAVPYYAAYLALLPQHAQEATAMFAQYQTFVRRGTQMTTPTQNPMNYPGGQGATTASQRVPVTGGQAQR